MPVDNDNVRAFPKAPKVNSPPAVAAQEASIEESFKQAATITPDFLKCHHDYLTEGKFEAHGAFILLWNRDGTYIINDAGILPSATMIGLLEITKQNFIARHIMSVTQMPVAPEPPKGDVPSV